MLRHYGNVALWPSVGLRVRRTEKIIRTVPERLKVLASLVWCCIIIHVALGGQSDSVDVTRPVSNSKIWIVANNANPNLPGASGALRRSLATFPMYLSDDAIISPTSNFPRPNGFWGDYRVSDPTAKYKMERGTEINSRRAQSAGLARNARLENGLVDHSSEFDDTTVQWILEQFKQHIEAKRPTGTVSVASSKHGSIMRPAVSSIHSIDGPVNPPRNDAILPNRISRDNTAFPLRSIGTRHSVLVGTMSEAATVALHRLETLANVRSVEDNEMNEDVPREILKLNKENASQECRSCNDDLPFTEFEQFGTTSEFEFDDTH